MLRILLIYFLIPFNLHSVEYGLFAKCQAPSPKRLAILAERCSGSNYVERLILSNFENLTPDQSVHKHFPPWNWKDKNTNSILYIVIFRNPYDWLRSLHLVPHHAVKSLHGIPFGQFIRSQWRLQIHDPIIIQLGDPMVDRHPQTGQPFKNVMELRTEKIKTMLQIRPKVKNIYYIKYETARDYPQEVLQEIQKIYTLKAKPAYRPVIHYQGESSRRIYSPKKYAPIRRNDLDHINAHLDKRIEKKIGYSLVSQPENIP